MKCSLFVPEHTSPAKLDTLNLMGADVTLFGKDCVEGELKARSTAKVLSKICKHLKKKISHLFNSIIFLHMSSNRAREGVSNFINIQ